jgi:Ubiquitin carboxyl-terminal hydrolase
MNVPGLKNSGNTCFFNGALQVVTHVPDERTHLTYLSVFNVVHHTSVHRRHSLALKRSWTACGAFLLRQMVHIQQRRHHCSTACCNAWRRCSRPLVAQEQCAATGFWRQSGESHLQHVYSHHAVPWSVKWQRCLQNVDGHSCLHPETITAAFCRGETSMMQPRHSSCCLTA